MLDSNQYIKDSESSALPIWLIPNKPDLLILLNFKMNVKNQQSKFEIKFFFKKRYDPV